MPAINWGFSNRAALPCNSKHASDRFASGCRCLPPVLTTSSPGEPAASAAGCVLNCSPGRPWHLGRSFAPAGDSNRIGTRQLTQPVRLRVPVPAANSNDIFTRRAGCVSCRVCTELLAHAKPDIDPRASNCETMAISLTGMIANRSIRIRIAPSQFRILFQTRRQMPVRVRVVQKRV